MKNKSLFICLLLFAQGFALDFFNYINQTINITNCTNITVNNDYIIMCPIAVLNQNITLNASQNYVNHNLNLTVSCNGNLDLNKSLAPGETYYNSTHNLSFYCKIDKINANLTLPYNGTYYNSTMNLSISCPEEPKLNTIKNLNYGETFQNTTLNLSLTCPINKFNINKILNYSETFENQLFNLSLKCNDYPKLNKTIFLKFNEEFSDQTLDLKVKAPGNLKVELLGDEIYTNDSIVFICKNNKLNKNIALKNNESVFFDSFNLSVKADCINVISDEFKINLTTLEAKLAYCENQKPIIQCNDSVLSFCSNELDFCSPDEKINASGGLVSCVKRVTNESLQLKEKLTLENTRLITELQQCRAGEQIQKELQENLIMIIVGIAGIFSAAIAVVYYLKSKQVVKGV